MRVVPLLLLTLAALPLFGQSNDVAVWAGSSSVGKTTLAGSDIRFDRGDAFGASFTHFFSHHYAAEIAAYDMRHDGTVRVQGVDVIGVGRLHMMSFGATLQWHAEHSRRIDPYLGGGLAWTRAGSLHTADLDNAGIGRVSIESRIGFTGLAGVSVGLVKQLAVAGEVRTIGYHPNSGPKSDQVRLELSPLLYSLGLRWRF